MDFDIFAPQVSTVSYDLAGKSILVYGSNRTGKTKNMCALPKPCYLMFENGLNAIPGVPFFPMNDWKSYVQFVKQITDPHNIARAREMYQTIILDTVEVMGNLCAAYVCTKFGVQSLGEKKKDPSTGKNDFAFNGYKELDNENRKWLNVLLNAGFTVAYIAHDGTRDIRDENGDEYTKIVPRGDKRIVDSICDAVDIIGYAVPNGLDNQGREIMSSLVLANSKRALAGSRFDYLTPYLQEFTADNLSKAVIEAVKKQEEMSGHKAVSFDDQQKTHETPKQMTHAELMEAIKPYGERCWDENTGKFIKDFQDIVDEYFGKGFFITDATADQDEQLALTLYDLRAKFGS